MEYLKNSSARRFLAFINQYYGTIFRWHSVSRIVYVGDILGEELKKKKNLWKCIFLSPTNPLQYICFDFYVQASIYFSCYFCKFILRFHNVFSFWKRRDVLVNIAVGYFKMSDI